MKLSKVALLSFFIPFVAAKSIKWVFCENVERPKHVDVAGNIYDRDRKTPTFTHLVANFDAFLSEISEKKFVTALGKAFSDYELRMLFSSVSSWEEGRKLDYPEPMFALQELVQLALDSRLHCPTANNRLGVSVGITARMAKIQEVDTTGWATRVDGLVDNEDEDLNDLGLGSLPPGRNMENEHSMEVTEAPEDPMQYLDNTISKLMMPLVWNYIYQMTQYRDRIISDYPAGRVYEASWEQHILLSRIGYYEGVYESLQKYADMIDRFGQHVDIFSKREATRGELLKVIAGKNLRGYQLGKKVKSRARQTWQGICNLVDKCIGYPDEVDDDISLVLEGI